jgi:hypothetical protein
MNPSILDQLAAAENMPVEFLSVVLLTTAVYAFGADENFGAEVRGMLQECRDTHPPMRIVPP